MIWEQSQSANNVPLELRTQRKYRRRKNEMYRIAKDRQTNSKNGYVNMSCSSFEVLCRSVAISFKFKQYFSN